MASPNTAGRPARPLSPHLTIYRWGPAMTVSILHRATGDGMAIVGMALLVWFLAALAGGPESYAHFTAWFTGGWAWLGYVVGIGLTLCLFQHMAGGIRHLVMDTGAAFELRKNRNFALATMVAAVVLTVLYWLYLGVK